jgi:predicted dehydrogenase
LASNKIQEKIVKVLVVGLGSIGQRHARNLLSHSTISVIGFDPVQTKLPELEECLNFNFVETFEQGIELNPNCVFICTPADTHIEYAKKALLAGAHLFIEKPLAPDLFGLSELVELAQRTNVVTMVGCNLRFHPAFIACKKMLDAGLDRKILAVKAEFGYSLPRWHPNLDYKQRYSADASKGGGVILDAIHEIDYLMWFFGSVKNVVGSIIDGASLGIEVETLVSANLNFQSGVVGNLHLDYLQLNYSRSFKLIASDIEISWQYPNAYLQVFELDKNYVLPEEFSNDSFDHNQPYLDQLQYFLDCTRANKKTFNDIECAVETQKVANMLKQNCQYISRC